MEKFGLFFTFLDKLLWDSFAGSCIRGTSPSEPFSSPYPAVPRTGTRRFSHMTEQQVRPKVNQIPLLFIPKGKLAKCLQHSVAFGVAPQRNGFLISPPTFHHQPFIHSYLSPSAPSTPKNVCVRPWNAMGPHFWELRWNNHISLAELKESTTYFSHLRL